MNLWAALPVMVIATVTTALADAAPALHETGRQGESDAQALLFDAGSIGALLDPGALGSDPQTSIEAGTVNHAGADEGLLVQMALPEANGALQKQADPSLRLLLQVQAIDMFGQFKVQSRTEPLEHIPPDHAFLAAQLALQPPRLAAESPDDVQLVPFVRQLILYVRDNRDWLLGWSVAGVVLIWVASAALGRRR